MVMHAIESREETWSAEYELRGSVVEHDANQ